MKKLLAVFLTLTVALSLSATAAAAGNIDVFQETLYKNESVKSDFSDVAESAWYHRPIELCRQMGFMDGYGGRFEPNSSLTVAQALTIAARVHQIYHEGECTLRNGSPWYQTYVDYCLKHKLCTEDMFLSWDVNITRNQMAYVFSKVVPDYELGVLNESTYTYADADGPFLYKDEIMKLYKAGVLTGSDEFGTFYALTDIKRCEAAAIITRVALPSERIMCNLLEPLSFDQRNSLILALPQGYEYTSKGYQTNFSSVGEGIFVNLWSAPIDLALDGKQITDLYTHDEVDGALQADLEKDGSIVNYPPHTETFRYNNTDVYVTSCTFDRNDGVTVYPETVQQFRFILDAVPYTIRYISIDDRYIPLFLSMTENLVIDNSSVR